jgi:hypothetical protein
VCSLMGPPTGGLNLLGQKGGRERGRGSDCSSQTGRYILKRLDTVNSSLVSLSLWFYLQYMLLLKDSAKLYT